MKLSDIHHPVPAHARSRALLLWLLSCVSVWGLGIAVSALLIDNLYCR